ncbi:hypothetical protein [Paenibacillus sp. NEAU-GSW1]|uniref:hypothetical protein n=1 Tax=Paenibacillus sp. NEAU-GSW1 TaxID=2682486 RepID=UPI0012E25379|nr:hypothetical protein [Paenibacillus sp. NEAU-GSW1]MUT65587.1 hypothetical protein [Paenibacillus sp. NEAU-GSW1]
MASGSRAFAKSRIFSQSRDWEYWTENEDYSEFGIENEAARVDVYYNGGIHPGWNVPVSWSTNGAELAAGDYTVESGKISIVLDRFTESGSYAV